MIERRVVVTGLGVVTPVGCDTATFWSNLKNGVSGIDRITFFDPAEFDCQIAGEARDFNPTGVFKNPKEIRRNDRYVLLAMGAAKMATKNMRPTK